MAHHKSRSDLRTSVRFNVDETTASFWSDARLNNCLERAVDRVWTEVRKLDGDYFMTTRTSTDGSLTILGETYDAASFGITAGTTTSITLPPDFADMRLMETVTTGYENVRWHYRKLSDPDFRTLRAIPDQVTPAYFIFTIVDERTLVYTPLSNTSLTTRITYTQVQPVLATDATELEMPHPLYMAVEQFATAHALAQDRNPDAAAWEAMGRSTIATVFGAHSRQRQDPEFVQDYL